MDKSLDFRYVDGKVFVPLSDLHSFVEAAIEDAAKGMQPTHDNVIYLKGLQTVSGLIQKMAVATTSYAMLELSYNDEISDQKSD